MARHLYERTHEKHLVIAGGVSLNSVMNGRILRETPFEDVYVMAAAGDNGTSIGAAYYLYHGLLGRPREFVHLSPHLGTEYDNAAIKKVLDEAKVPYEYKENVAEVAAQKLHARRIVGWFQGRMEIGPRALGSRSILADPTDPGMKDKVNAEVKHREAYRPFAPSSTVEARNDYFDIGVEDPFMLKVCNVLPEKRTVLPAITHVDGTARLQTVRRETNPLYHELISQFGRLSGVPVVLNTSFNIMGEPIVESPVNALRCFYSTGLDDLVMGNYVVSKP
jgi:carbamoyltransferase